MVSYIDSDRVLIGMITEHNFTPELLGVGLGSGGYCFWVVCPLVPLSIESNRDRFLKFYAWNKDGI